MNLNIPSGLLAAGDGPTMDQAALPLDVVGLPSAFAQLLSERFLPDEQLSDDPATAPLRANDADAPALNRHQLNQLLPTLSQQGKLPAALQRPSVLDDVDLLVDINTLTDEEKPPLTLADDPALLQQDSAQDSASLQTLLAMLPVTSIALQQVSGTTLSGEQHVPQLPATAQWFTTLRKNSENPVAPLSAQPAAAASTDKPAAGMTTVQVPQADGTTGSPDLPLKAAAEPVQALATLHHALPTPVASHSIATTPSNATVSAPATPQLNAQLGSPEWQQALSQQVLIFQRNGQQSAELRLHPQELGALQITLKLDDTQAQLHIASAHGQVRSAVEAALPYLRHALAENGINLGQSSVGGESLPQQSQQQTAQRDNTPSYREQHGSAENGVESVSAPAALQAMARSVDGVDIFA